jgi:hypothetical protein
MIPLLSLPLGNGVAVVALIVHDYRIAPRLW